MLMASRDAKMDSRTNAVMVSAVSIVNNSLLSLVEFCLNPCGRAACRGGWPQAIDMREEIALDQAADYYDSVVNADITVMAQRPKIR